MGKLTDHITVFVYIVWDVTGYINRWCAKLYTWSLGRTYNVETCFSQQSNVSEGESVYVCVMIYT